MMADMSELYTALRNADKAGDTAAAKKLAQYIQSQTQQPAAPAQHAADWIPGTPEGAPKETPKPKQNTAGFVGSNLNMGVANLVGMPVDTILDVYDMGKAALGYPISKVTGKAPPSWADPSDRSKYFGSGQNIADKFAATGAITQDATPTSKGQEYAARALQFAPSAMTGRGSPRALAKGTAGAMAAGAASKGAEDVTGGQQPAGIAGSYLPAVMGAAIGEHVRMPNLPTIPKKPKAEMAGVGAARTEEALQRAEYAKSLPVPVDLTKGQKTRDFDQLKFEKETAKLPEGKRLRDRYGDQNEKILQNFDAFDDLTGSQQRSLRAVGKAVNEALVTKAKEKKAQIAAAYKAAKEAGQMKEPVEVGGLRTYLEENRSAMRNAPVLSTVAAELKRLTKGGNTLSLAEMEELRKTIGKASNMAGPDAKYAPELKALIDSATEGKGGDLYKQARRLHENFSKEFKDKAVVAKMLKTKPGTTDRAVAYEDVFKHSILDGSLDDVRALRRTLQTSGEGGQQAWKELQGQTIRHLKEAVTKSVQLDERGNPIVSPAALDKLIREMDKDGKLDFIFGKKGAEQLRTINDIAKDVYTSPPGSVNHSNTSSAILGALADFAASFAPAALGGHATYLPVGTIGMAIKKNIATRRMNKRVDDALDGPIPPKDR